MLDTEVDRGLRSGIQDCLTSMLQTLAPDDLTHWLGLCKSVLSAAKTGDERKDGKGRILLVIRKTFFVRVFNRSVFFVKVVRTMKMMKVAEWENSIKWKKRTRLLHQDGRLVCLRRKVCKRL